MVHSVETRQLLEAILPKCTTTIAAGEFSFLVVVCKGGGIFDKERTAVKKKRGGKRTMKHANRFQGVIR